MRFSSRPCCHAGCSLLLRGFVLFLGLWTMAGSAVLGQFLPRKLKDDGRDYSDYVSQSSIVSVDTFAFLAGGHCYGAHENSRSTFASASLYAAKDRLFKTDANFTFLLGDCVRDGSDSLQVTQFYRLMEQLPGIVRLVPGNHDLGADHLPPVDLWSRLHHTAVGLDQMLLLNTESLRFGGGKALLQEIEAAHAEVNQFEGRELRHNLFVFSHRLLWALAEPGFAEMDDFANEPFAPMVSRDTVQMIYEAVLRLAGKRPIHWFSGDIGASWSENVFYGASADSSRHFYAAGLGDCPEDAFWHVRVDSLGKVDAQVWMLNGAKPKPLQYYGMDGWRTRMQNRQALAGQGRWHFLKTRVFWLGFGLGGIVVLVICWVWGRMRRR